MTYANFLYEKCRIIGIYGFSKRVMAIIISPKCTMSRSAIGSGDKWRKKINFAGLFPKRRAELTIFTN